MTVNGFVGKWASVNVQSANGLKTAYVHSSYLKKGTSGNLYSYTSNQKSKKSYSTAYYQTGTKKYYVNSEGERVQSPTYYKSPPANVTALCRDGTYSFSHNRRGTCSHHGGVARWL